MSTTDNLALAELRRRLHDYMLGHAHADAARMAALDLPGWAVAARIELIRRHPLVQVLDDELLEAIAWRVIDPGVEACHLALRLRDVERDIAADTGQGGEGGPAAGARRPDLPTTALGQMEATLALIARSHLGFETLQTRRSDRLDFRDCSVWSIRAALVEAYEEGWHAAS
jgi:hypothetical protein